MMIFLLNLKNLYNLLKEKFILMFLILVDTIMENLLGISKSIQDNLSINIHSLNMN